MSKYELTISKDYVPDWGVVEAIRELFQNALDQETIEESNPMYFDYDEDEETLTIGNKNSVLEVSSLLLGNSSKAGDENTIGQFGEGYKLAILILLREGLGLKINNYGKKEVWRPRFVKSTRYKQEIPTIFTEKKNWSKPPNNSLEFIVTGITDEMYEEIIETNLHLQDLKEVRVSPNYGRVLVDKELKGKIFVNGLFVTEDYDVDYGYDFIPRVLKLKRDRSMVGNFDLKTSIANLWTDLEDLEDGEIAKMVINESSDISYLSSTYVSHQHSDEIYAAFKEVNGENSIPIDSSTDIQTFMEDHPDAKPIIVSSETFSIIIDSEDYIEDLEEMFIEKDRTVSEKLRKWYIKLGEERYFDSEEKDEFEEIFLLIESMEGSVKDDD